MCTTRKFALGLAASIACICLTGCESVSEIEREGGNYYTVTYARPSMGESPGHRIALRYHEPDGRWLRGRRVTVWPSLLSRVAVRDDSAAFVALKAFDPPLPGEPRATRTRLFAVRGAGPPLDIQDELLWRWSKESGKDFSKVLTAAGGPLVQEKNGGLDVLFGFPTMESWGDATIHLEWSRLADIMREVEASGVVRTDRVWGLPYIEKDFHK